MILRQEANQKRPILKICSDGVLISGVLSGLNERRGEWFLDPIKHVTASSLNDFKDIPKKNVSVLSGGFVNVVN